MRKSNWSDLLMAFAMSARERVRLLFESAMMNARAVISAMNTGAMDTLQGVLSNSERHTFAGFAEEDRG